MKKLYLLVSAFLLLSSVAGAQVISNFNTVLGTWEKASDSGYGLDSLFLTTDPTNVANGVMGVHITFDDSTADTTNNLHARFEYGVAPAGATYLPLNGAKMLTFWVYLDSAQNIPDSLGIDTYMMNNVHWAWTEHAGYAKDIPKNVWYPLSFPAAEYFAKNPNFDIVNNQFMFGLQFFPDKTTKWHGTIYVDNVELLGALPSVVSNFNTALGTWEKSGDSGYGLDSVYRTTDPKNPANGVMGVHITFDDATADTTTNLHARFDYGSAPGGATYLPLNGAAFLTHWVYLDSAQNIPDSLGIDSYMMNNVHWAWTEHVGYAIDIPKNVWYPLSFPAAEYYAKNPNFDVVNNQFMFGLQIFPDKTTKWHGTIYVDDVEMWSNKVAPPPAIWNAADFENGKNGFTIPAHMVGRLTNVLDIKTSNGTYVLQDAVNLKTTPGKIGIVRDSVPMQRNVDSVATKITMEVYLPNKFPLGGTVDFYVNGGADDSINVSYKIDGTEMKINSWNTVVIDKLDSLKTAGKFDPTKPAKVGVTISYAGDTATFAGNLLFDNLVITGEWFGEQLIDGVRQTGNEVATSFALYQNYPNPFNPSTKISYDVPKASQVVLTVFDVLGQEVATLVNETQAPGSHTVTFNASRFASGLYFYRLSAGSSVQTRKMLLLK